MNLENKDNIINDDKLNYLMADMQKLMLEIAHEISKKGEKDDENKTAWIARARRTQGGRRCDLLS